ARMPLLTFSPTGDRIFFMESKPGAGGVNTYLSSVKLSGDDYKQHIESKYATEMVPSPDNQWVFFKELHKLYIAPFLKTGKMLRLGASEAIVPVKTVSGDSGDWLAWSSDGKSVQWTLGENFYEQTLDNIFKQLAKDEKAPEPRATKIGFEFE